MSICGVLSVAGVRVVEFGPNATRVQSLLGGQTHRHIYRHIRRAPQYLLRSPSDAAKVITKTTTKTLNVTLR